MKQINLVVGKRYWLDPVKDISGIYVGRNTRSRHEFKDIEGNYIYLLQEDGTVSFDSEVGYQEYSN